MKDKLDASDKVNIKQKLTKQRSSALELRPM